MPTNDVVILNKILDEKRNSIASELSESDYFEIFTSEQVLKDYELSYEEIINGIVGNGGDGGIDSIYILINGVLLKEDTDLSRFKKNVEMQLIFVQSKISQGFDEETINKFIDVSENLLNLSSDINSYISTYNKKLLNVVELFRKGYQDLATRFPKLKISYFYVTKGEKVNHTLYAKAEKLQTKIKEMFSAAECEMIFIGAKELLDLTRKAPRITYSLTLAENPISSTTEGSYICLVSLKEYYNFIDDEGTFHKSLFEPNVRDYQGKTPVNEQIQNTLRHSQGEDFWWLNNGVTILASKATSSGKTLQIENPEVVNGLQTSAEIHKYFTEANSESEKRNLLVRVVTPQDPESSDRIIKATNSQTSIPTASLRATDKIHRDIEEYFKTLGYFYDRKKNYYKNLGKPINRIISIPHLAQVFMAVILRRPNDSRARPSSLLGKDEDYKKIFSASYPIEVYFKCFKLMESIEKHLKSDTWKGYLDPSMRNDIKFHIAMHIAGRLVGKKSPKAPEIITSLSEKEELIDGFLQDSTQRVSDIFLQMGATNQIAKNPEFVKKVIEDIDSLLDIDDALR